MAGCGPDPRRGCIPEMAIGSVQAEMPSHALPVSTLSRELHWKTTASVVLCNQGLVVKKREVWRRDYGQLKRKKKKKKDGRSFKAELSNEAEYSN